MKVLNLMKKKKSNQQKAQPPPQPSAAAKFCRKPPPSIHATHEHNYHTDQDPAHHKTAINSYGLSLAQAYDAIAFGQTSTDLAALLGNIPSMVLLCL